MARSMRDQASQISVRVRFAIAITPLDGCQSSMQVLTRHDAGTLPGSDEKITVCKDVTTSHTTVSTAGHFERRFKRVKSYSRLSEHGPRKYPGTYIRSARSYRLSERFYSTFEECDERGPRFGFFRRGFLVKLFDDRDDGKLDVFDPGNRGKDLDNLVARVHSGSDVVASSIGQTARYGRVNRSCSKRNPGVNVGGRYI